MKAELPGSLLESSRAPALSGLHKIVWSWNTLLSNPQLAYNSMLDKLLKMIEFFNIAQNGMENNLYFLKHAKMCLHGII